MAGSSLVGKALKAGATKYNQLKHHLPKDIARRKVDQKFLKKVKNISDANRKLGKTLNRAPGIGKMFETTKDVAMGGNTFKKVKDYSAAKPLGTAKNLAMPMLASAGLKSHIDNKKEKEKRKALEELKKGGNEKVANISQLLTKTASDLEKSASVIRQLQGKNEEKLKKIASIKRQNKQRDKAFNKLIKMAEMEQISVDEIPEKLEKMASMDEEDFEVEMRVMDKVAEKSLLEIGDLSKKASGSGNPLVDFVMNNS
jgi:hypothetical protein